MCGRRRTRRSVAGRRRAELWVSPVRVGASDASVAVVPNSRVMAIYGTGLARLEVPCPHGGPTPALVARRGTVRERDSSPHVTPLVVAAQESAQAPPERPHPFALADGLRQTKEDVAAAGGLTWSKWNRGRCCHQSLINGRVLTNSAYHRRAPRPRASAPWKSQNQRFRVVPPMWIGARPSAPLVEAEGEGGIGVAPGVGAERDVGVGAQHPVDLGQPPAITSASCSCSATRTTAMRSTSPAQEYTSATLSRSAMACAASPIRSAAARTSAIAVITTWTSSRPHCGRRSTISLGHPPRSGSPALTDRCRAGLLGGVTGYGPSWRPRCHPPVTDDGRSRACRCDARRGA